METKRLILRRWEEDDAEDLYRFACDPQVGPAAGWPPHKSIEESRSIIRNVLNGKESYAICLKEDGKAIGTIELKLYGRTDMTERDDECELGFCLSRQFWGAGIVPEAANEMLRHAFEDCGMNKVWIGYYEGNEKSRRVQEKCGFIFQWRSENVPVPQMNEVRTGYVSLMTREDWQKKKDYELMTGQLKALTEGVTFDMTDLANAASLLYNSLPEVNWAGFYLLKDDELLLGPFMGKPACVRIKMGRGVCGTAAQKEETIVVPDVHLFPGHIACDESSRSEIVIPLKLHGTLYGVLDMDSPVTERFSEADKKGLEAFARELERALEVRGKI